MPELIDGEIGPELIDGEIGPEVIDGDDREGMPELLDCEGETLSGGS